MISGAYFGDKMTPLSETTILTPQIVGSNVYTHIRSMAKATIPAYLISLVIFFFIGRVNEISATVDTTATLQALESSYNISLWNLLPVLVLLLLGTPQISGFSLHPDRHAGRRPGGGGIAIPGRGRLCQ